MTPGQIKLAVILFVIACTIGGTAYIAWDYRGAIAQEEKEQAVKDATSALVDRIEKKLDDERAAREEYRAQVDATLASTQEALARVNGTITKANAALAADRAKNVQFYAQPLPDGGRTAWLTARAAAAAPAASSASSPSR